MSTTTGIAIYFLVWWISLFAVLPWGVRSQHEDGGFEEGTDPGAPVMAGVWRKLVYTTVLATVVFACLWSIYEFQLITLDGFVNFFGMRR